MQSQSKILYLHGNTMNIILILIFFLASLIREVHSGTRDIETICIACDNVNAVVSVPHPYFNGGVCEQCKVNSSLVISN